MHSGSTNIAGTCHFEEGHACVVDNHLEDLAVERV